MDVLTWRKWQVNQCISTFLPLILDRFAQLLETKVTDIKILPIDAKHSTKGFHFSNVSNLVFKLQKYDTPLSIKIPIPNEDDIFIVNDSYRTFTIEMVDSLVSVRNVNNILDLRFQFLNTAISCFECKSVRVANFLIPFYQMLTKYLTEDELRKYNCYFVVTSSSEKIENMYSSVLPNKKLLWSQLPPERMNCFLKSIYNSFFVKKELKFNFNEKCEVILDSIIDPITSYIYNVKSWRDILLFTLKTLHNKKDKDLVGSNLEFKRLRSFEVILAVFYRKLIETFRSQKKQKQIRLAGDFLLKSMFTNASIQPLFEYLELINMYKEMSMKFKVVMLIDFLPYDLRDVHSSYMYNIDPFHTPDDEKIGKIQHLAIHCNIDEFGRFIL